MRPFIIALALGILTAGLAAVPPETSAQTVIYRLVPSPPPPLEETVIIDSRSAPAERTAARPERRDPRVVRKLDAQERAAELAEIRREGRRLRLQPAFED